jgi:hopanoid C-2 methylase
MTMTKYRPQNNRKILCIFPAHAPSYGTFHHLYPLMGKKVKASMPAQGLLTIAAYLPKTWEIRFIDEGIRPTKEDEYTWADAVFISGMHIQIPDIERINKTAHKYGKITVLGGPSVSACPEYHPHIDILHIGELGDSTDLIIKLLDESLSRPERQISFNTKNRLSLSEFPVPAYNLIDIEEFFVADILFSSGCPYRCDFCDIPELYGRKIRVKTPEQIINELDALMASGNMLGLYFVDDNFIGDKKAARELLKHLVLWQKKNKYPVQFACEATLNLALNEDILKLMHEAWFVTVYCGIETPEPEALKGISKNHNLMKEMSILEAVKKINNYGIEVSGGIMFGLDTDTMETGEKNLGFIKDSNIPMLSINLVFALPKTPLWRRLEKEDRLVHDKNRDSNIKYLMPHDQVVKMWKDCVSSAYEPGSLYQRFHHNMIHTYPNRLTPHGLGLRDTPLPKLIMGLRFLKNIFFQIGLKSHYKKTFWKLAIPAILKGQFAELVNIALVGHHLILFGEECNKGEESASFFSQKVREKE